MYRIFLENKLYCNIPVASLLFGTLENAVKLLFTRDTHFQFGLVPLTVALVYFFIMICWATGTAVASGALVPML